MFDRMPKILGVTWPKPRPFWGKFCIYRVGQIKWHHFTFLLVTN